MRIKLKELCGSKCVALDDGQKVYQQLFPELREKRTVELDFSGVDLVFSPFLMGALGKLLDHFEKETVMQRVSLCHISEEHLRSVNDFLDRADQRASEASDVETMRDLFEEDELGDI
ncbi:MAG: STAS-like domain-containing protein [Nitrospina sp.]|nr:STAS-like domain-containing protein [Nitrospina sp.]